MVIQDNNTIVEDKKIEETPINELHEKPLSEILANDNGDDWADAEKAEEKEATSKTPEDKKPVTEDKPTVIPEEKPQATSPAPLDSAKLEENITEGVAKKLIEQFAPEDATKQEKKDIDTQIKDLYEKAKKEGREVTFGEAIALVKQVTQEELKVSLKDEVKAEVMKDLESEVVKEEQAEENKKAIEQEQIKNLHAGWAREFKMLTDTGKIPAVKDRMNKDDIGLQAELQIMSHMKELATERAKNNDPTPITVSEIFLTKYKAPNVQPDGENAPINGARKSITPEDKNNTDYNQIHNASFEDILSGSYR